MSVKILVVDDDFANQRVASLFLKKLGYDTDVADNGQKAVDLIQTTEYQLILMDCQMPVMDGFSATRAIRESNTPNSKIPILALTANVMAGVNGECENAGMDDVINKPLQLASLEQTLNHWLNKD